MLTRLPRWYPWVIVGVMTIVILLATGARGSFGAFFKAIQDEFGWDRATVSGAAAVNAVAWALSQPLIGRLIDRFGAKWSVVISLVVMVVGVVPLYWVDSVLALYFFFGVLPGVAYTGATLIPAATLSGRWFEQRAGLATGITSAAVPLGQAIANPVAAVLVTSIGWRLSYVALGAVIVACLPFVTVLLRDAPPDASRFANAGSPGRTDLAGISAGAAARTPLFWLLLLSQASCGFVDLVVGIHFIPFVSDLGRSEVFAALILGGVGVFAVVGSILSGWLSDRVGPKAALFSLHALRVIGLPMLIAFGLTGSDWWLYLFAPLFGATSIMGFSATSVMVRRMFGPRSLGAVVGNLQLNHHLGSAAGAWLAGVIYDGTGSYYPAFAVATAIAAVASFGVLWIDQRRKPYYHVAAAVA